MRDVRKITVGDENKKSIQISLWGSVCNTYDYEVGQIIALKECRISDYGGKSLNASSSPSDIKIENIKHRRYEELKKWVESQSLSTIQ